MAKQNKLLLAFNRGVVSRIGLARIDIERMSMSAEIMLNWMPRVLGSMMLRPGLGFIDRINNDVVTNGRILPFLFSVDDAALLEISPQTLQVRDPVTDLLIQRTAISSQLLNTGFNTDLTSWVDASQAGGSVVHLAGGFAGMKGDGTDFGILRQTVTVSGPDTGVDHFLLIRIEDGPVRFKVGSAAGLDDFFAETRLARGEHSLKFIPTGNFTVEFANEREFNIRVDSCNVKTAGGDASNDDWQQFNDQMISAARAALTAISNQDEEALFNAGNDQLYPPCESCHQKYMAQ